MKSTTLRENAGKNILIAIGIVVGIVIVNKVLENVASFLAYYFA